MTISFENILEELKIEDAKQEEYEMPEIKKLSNDMSFPACESIDEMNRILSAYELCIYNENDVLERRLEVLGLIFKEKAFSELSIVDLKRRYEMILRWEAMENKSDMLEVELANMEAEGRSAYFSKSILELEDILKRTIEEVKRIKNAEKRRDVLDEILLKKDKSYKLFQHAREETKGIFYKMLINEKLRDRADDGSKVLLKIVNERKVNLDKIAQELGIERVNLLKIIYSMSSRNIIEFDRLNNTVSLTGYTTTLN